MAIRQEQGETWGTQNVVLEGGLYLDKDVLYQATQMPGSARQLVNFEPSLDGGYHRILGYQLFDTNQLPHGAVQVFGVVVSHFESSVIAMQSGDTYRSTGSGWTKINGADNHSAMGKVEHTDYTWATTRFAFVDGDPNAYPVRIEAGGAYTVLSNAPKGQKFIREFAGYLWMSDGTGSLTFSAPQDDTTYTALAGAGELNVGFNIVGLGVWRGALYIFGEQRIAQVTGTSAVDWQVTPLTDQIGMTTPYTLQEVNGDLIYLSSDGIRTISGTARVFDRELGVISRPINTIVIPLGTANFTSTVVKTKSQYRLFQSTSATEPLTAPGIIGALKLQASGSVAWEWSQIAGIKVSCADDGLFNGSELLIHAAWDGYVYKQESGTDFNGTPIQALYQTPYLVYNDPNIRTILHKMSSNFRSSGTTMLNVGVTFDYGNSNVFQPSDIQVTLFGGAATWDDGETWNEAGVDWDIVPEVNILTNLYGSGFTSSFSFSSSGGADYSLQAYTLQYSQGARR